MSIAELKPAEQPTSEGKVHIERWMAAQNELEFCKSRLNSAQCEMANSTNALGKWMCPDDAKPGEKFALWWGSSLIEVEFLRMGDYAVRVRSRGKRGLQP